MFVVTHIASNVCFPAQCSIFGSAADMEDNVRPGQVPSRLRHAKLRPPRRACKGRGISFETISVVASVLIDLVDADKCALT